MKKEEYKRKGAPNLQFSVQYAAEVRPSKTFTDKYNTTAVQKILKHKHGRRRVFYTFKPAEVTLSERAVRFFEVRFIIVHKK